MSTQSVGVSHRVDLPRDGCSFSTGVRVAVIMRVERQEVTTGPYSDSSLPFYVSSHTVTHAGLSGGLRFVSASPLRYDCLLTNNLFDRTEDNSCDPGTRLKSLLFNKRFSFRGVSLDASRFPSLSLLRSTSRPSLWRVLAAVFQTLTAHRAPAARSFTRCSR